MSYNKAIQFSVDDDSLLMLMPDKISTVSVHGEMSTKNNNKFINANGFIMYVHAY